MRALFLSLCLVTAANTTAARDPAPVKDYGSCAAYHLTKFNNVTDNAEKQHHLEKYAETLNDGVAAGYTLPQIEQSAEQGMEALAAAESGDDVLDELSSSCDEI
jgi:hypothetical protein